MVYKGLKDHPDCRDPRETRGTPLLVLGDQEDFLVVKEVKQNNVIAENNFLVTPLPCATGVETHLQTLSVCLSVYLSLKSFYLYISLRLPLLLLYVTQSSY